MVPRAGFFFGITGAIHSVVDELSDETNQSTAFPLYDIISTLGGRRASPLIGDTFAEPASEWPDAFTHPAWTTYPYLLPCLISAAVAVVAAVLARFALEEGSSDFNHFVWFLHPYTIGKAQTLLSKRTRKTPLVEEEPLIDTGASAAVDVPPTLADLQPLGVRALLALPVLRAVFLASGGIGFAGSCFTNVFVLMAYTPLRQGGLALSPAQIGRAISAMGALSIAPKLCTPKLLRRFGTLGRFDFAMPAWVATFATMPLASLVAQRTASAAEWAAVGLVLFLSRLGCLAFSIIMIPTRALTPGSASLGTANGLAELTQSLAGAVSPTVVNSLFAFSASRHLLGGHLWVVFMLLESGFGCWVARRIRRYH